MWMNLAPVDWLIVALVFLLTIVIGLLGSRKAGKSMADYFVGGRSMPWWLLGFSMVATTFSTDAPHLVTNLVREKGVCGNWVWWAMLPSGMLTAFLYAKYWRRSGTLTDLEYYEIRYSGRTAAVLRGFRAVYLGLFFNVIIMASVTLAAIKIGGAMLGLAPWQSVLGAMIITACFSAAAGLRGVLLSDFFLFVISMAGAFAAAYFAMQNPAVGGWHGMVEKLSASPELLQKSGVFDFASTADWIACFIIPFAVVWWSVFYPGAEPGGGGFLVQRMLAAKDEKNAVGATLFFNVTHYALRPWPWMLVAICSLLVYPDRTALISALNGILPESQIQSDVAYSLMLKDLPAGWLGLTAASLFAAYVSTMSTLLNWGSSYLIHDFYGRFIRRNATEKDLVCAGRVATVALMVLAGLVALCMESAVNNFNIILSIGAGTGLLFLLRWFWWRINAAAEITAMISSFLFALYFNMIHARIFPEWILSDSEKMIYAVILTTVAWFLASCFGPATEKKKLVDFYRLIRPAGPGWNAVRRMAAAEEGNVSSRPAEPVWPGLVASLFGCFSVFVVLYGTGEFIYLRWLPGVCAFVFAFGTGWLTWYFGITLPRRFSGENR